MPTLGDAEKFGMGSVLMEAARKYFGGSSAALARWIGVSDTTLFGWLHDKSIPSLGNALNIASKLGISLAALHRGHADALAQQLPLSLTAPEFRYRKRIDWAVVEGDVRQFMEEHPPISATEASRRLGISRRTLSSRCPELMHALSRRYEESKGEEYRERMEARREAMRKVLREQVRRGDKPLAKRTKLALEGRGVHFEWRRYKQEYLWLAAEPEPV